jgi:two-component system, chemotaxis family, response regulator Rcp1
MADLPTTDVLLVEDSPADIYLIQRAVAEWGHNIRLWLVTNGLDALTFLRKEGSYLHASTPALIILDINLPQMHGSEVFAELRALPAYHATPVIMFTSARQDIEEAHCLQLGATAYVRKPIDLTAFFAAVHNILRTWLLPEGTA